MVEKIQIDDFYLCLEDGLSLKDACAISGISTNWYYDHKANDQDFVHGISVALAKCKKKYLDTVKKAVDDGDWKAAAWFLERKFKDDFSTKQEIAGYLEKSEDESERKKRKEEVAAWMDTFTK